MNNEVIVTCAVTGAGDTVGRHPAIPVTPSEIATAAIEAAAAGAAIVHIHVRDPETGKGTRDPALYREVVARIRDAGTDVVINLTAGMGGDFYPSAGNPAVGGPGTDMVGAVERLIHVEELRPDICSLDCGSLNFGDSVYVSSPDMLRTMARRIKEAGVKPEMEVFDTGHVRFANQLVADGLVTDPPLYQICLGIPWGAPAEPGVMKTMTDLLPANAVWAGFAISRMEMPFAAQAVLLGGHVRVGLEDNLYLERGVFASNAQLVEKAITLIELMGARVKTPDQARATLGLERRN